MPWKLGPEATPETPGPESIVVPNEVYDLVTPETLWGLLRPWSSHARRILVEMLLGASVTQAARRVGLAPETIRRWAIDRPPFAVATQTAFSWGASRFEDELTRRALAGADDRGSMRALEIVVRARMPEYRESGTVRVEVLREAELAAQSWVAGTATHILPEHTEDANPHGSAT